MTVIKKERKRYWESRIFLNYLVSNVLIVFLAINILSIVTVGHIIKNMKDEEIRIVQDKLQTVAEDIESQFDTMRDISLEISSIQCFRSYYFTENKYREIEMLERLNSYNQNYGIFDYFFLTYPITENIFTSAKTTMPLSVYYRTAFPGSDDGQKQSFFDWINRDGRQEHTQVYQQGTKRLIPYPLNQFAPYKRDIEGILCFQIDEKLVWNRVNKLVGELDGNLAIYYGDVPVLGNADDFQEYSDGVFVLSSHSQNVKVYYRMNDTNTFAWKNVFTAKEIAVFFVLVAILFLLGAVIAYWNWKPLGKLTAKYSTKLDKRIEADWASIDLVLETLLTSKNNGVEQLQKQYRKLREHTIRLIAYGYYSEKVQEYMTLLDIRIDTMCYGLVVCPLVKCESDVNDHQEIHQSVEELSGEGISLYAFWDHDNRLGILATMEESYQIENIVELIQSLLETKQLPTEVHIVGVYSDLKQIAGNNLSRTTLNNNASTLGHLEVEEELEPYDKVARQALAYIKDNYSNCDLSLDMVADRFKITSAYLCRIIKQELNMGYKEYLTLLRIDEAKRLLHDKNASVADVCQRSGYKNASYFIKVFQKYTGMTPAKYRDESSL